MNAYRLLIVSISLSFSAAAYSFELKEIDSKWLDEKPYLNYAYIDASNSDSNLANISRIIASGDWTIDVQNGLAVDGNRIQLRLLSNTATAAEITLRQDRNWFDRNIKYKRNNFQVFGTSEEYNSYISKVRRRGSKVLFYSRSYLSRSFLISISR